VSAISGFAQSHPSTSSRLPLDFPCSRPCSGPCTILISPPTSAVSQDDNPRTSHRVPTLTPYAFLTAHPPVPPLVYLCTHPTTAPAPSSSSSRRGRRPRSTRRSCTSTRASCTRLSVGESVSGAGLSYSVCAAVNAGISC
jgi:hypothetical protein